MPGHDHVCLLFFFCFLRWWMFVLILLFGKDGDVEGFGVKYHMVLDQIPMCNEREVYEQSISAVCQTDWPKDRILVQVLDDSDDESIQDLIRAEVNRWSQKGVNINYRHRLVRTGYKAGNLKSAVSCDYV